MADPRIGVVLVNWNGADDTVVALESLLAAVPPPASVVVVDNGSTEESIAQIVDWGARCAPSMECIDAEASACEAAWMTVVRAGSNRGFSGGNNIGLRLLATRAELTHFLLLNNDAMVAPDYFARIGDALERAPDAGLIGCLIYHHPDRERIWYAGSSEIPYRALLVHRYAPPADDAPHPTTFVTGCAMLIARRVYETIGGLPECYNPIYWEDGDYSFHVRRAGWPVLIAPAAHVYHRVGASAGGERLTPRVAYWQNRNRVFFVRRNYRGVQRMIALAYLFATKPARALAEGLRGRVAMGSAILRGFVRGLVDAAA